jgi:hypothetical protein
MLDTVVPLLYGHPSCNEKVAYKRIWIW